MMKWWVILILVFGGGCAGSETSRSTGLNSTDAAPVDFSLDLQGRSVYGEWERLVVFPDGAIHFGRGRLVDGLPARVGRLDRARMDELWEELQKKGLIDSSAGAAVEAWSEEVDIRLDLTGRGKRWSLRESGEESQALKSLLNWLKRVAWIHDNEESRGHMAQRRYDLGPDPYARYREP